MLPSGSPQRVIGANGLALKGNGTSTYFYRNRTIDGFNIRNFTMLGIVEGAATIDARVFSYGSSTSENPLVCIGSGRIQAPFTPARIFVRDINGYSLESQALETTDAVFEDGIPHTFVMTCGYAEGESVITLSGYVDGKYQGYTEANALASTPINRTCVGGLLRSGFAVPSAAKFYFGLLLNRRLSAVEIAALTANPGELFKRPQTRIFVPVGGGAEPTNVILTATGISTSPATLGNPPLAQNHVLTGAAISASVVLGTPTVAQIHTLTATTISTTPTLGTPALTVVAPSGLTAQDISTQPATLGTPLLNQAHALAASSIAASPAVLGTPAIAQKHVLIATAISTRPVLGTPVLTQVAPGMLSAQSITTAPAVLGTPALAQNHVLSAGAIAAGPPTFTTPTLRQQHAMLAQWITTGAVVLGRPVLVEGGAPAAIAPGPARYRVSASLRNYRAQVNPRNYRVTK